MIHWLIPNAPYSYPPFFEENPFGIYEKILLGRLKLPTHFDSASRDLIKNLLKHGTS